MFLQRLSLDPNTTYETSAPAHNLLENMLLRYKHIPHITLYSSKAASDGDIESMLEGESAPVQLTVPQYGRFRDRFDSSHIIVPEFDLINDFGFSAEDFDKPLIVNGCHGFEKLPLCRFWIFAERNDRFVAIYILSQLFSATIFTKEVNRMLMFCRIFGLDCKVHSFSDDADEIDTECAILLDGHREIAYERVFVVGSKSVRYEKLDLDLSSAGKYKYRICSVMQQVTRNVAKRMDTFDYSVYSRINN